MPTWKSPIFSDIRNAIGNNVVFSQWKGRPFFRSYVIPANPNTLAQQCQRLNSTAVVKRYQGIMGDADVKAAWNKSALPYLISGYNLFTKWGRGSRIKGTPTSGSTPLAVTVSYKCTIPLARARIYSFNGAAWADVTPVAGLEASVGNADKTCIITLTGAGTYKLYLADADTVVEGDSDPMAYQAITDWYPDEDTGLNDENSFVVS
jgi:hypothetical protein